MMPPPFWTPPKELTDPWAASRTTWSNSTTTAAFVGGVGFVDSHIWAPEPFRPRRSKRADAQRQAALARIRRRKARR